VTALPPPPRTPAPSKNNSTFYRGHLPLVRVSVGVIELVFRVTVTIIKVGYIQGCSGAGTQWNAVPANRPIVGHRWNANTEAFRQITSYSLD